MQPAPDERLKALTPHQYRVALLLGQGLTYAEIADRLALIPHTVHDHIRHIYERLSCNRREQVVLILAQAGVLN